jgi:hypothetical protein
VVLSANLRYDRQYPVTGLGWWEEILRGAYPELGSNPQRQAR